MTLRNEFVPTLEEERSEFFRIARAKFCLGFVPSDKWTVDRSKDRVLLLAGRGHDIDSKDEEYWRYLDETGEYRFMTKLLESWEISKTRVHLKRSIRFNGGFELADPTDIIIQRIQDALTVCKDYGVISRYESCDLELISAKGSRF